VKQNFYGMHYVIYAGDDRNLPKTSSVLAEPSHVLPVFRFFLAQVIQ